MTVCSRVMLVLVTATLVCAGPVAAQDTTDVARTDTVVEGPAEPRTTGHMVAMGAFAGFAIGTTLSGMAGLASDDEEWGMLIIIPGALLGTVVGALVGLIMAYER